MNININRTIIELELLIDNAPLSKSERQQHVKNMQAVRKLKEEWESQKVKQQDGNDSQ